MYVYFPKAKNDQFHEGNSTMFEAKKGSPYCPVFLISKYFQRLGYSSSSSGFFLPRIISKRTSERGRRVTVQMPDPTNHVSYDTCLKDRRKLLTKLGLEAKEFTEHSDRVGGMSHLVNNGLSVEEAQHHGRWKSLESAQKYVQKSDENKRKISRYFFGKD